MVLMSTPSTIRRQHSDDTGAVRSVVEAAFGRPGEADLIDALYRERAVVASFVAEVQQRVVGHLLFSRVLIETSGGAHPAAALAPLAVHPDFHRQGIGTGLVEFGLESLKSGGERAVLVLGEPRYYTRFGFSTDAARALQTPFPPDAFMALELVAGALGSIHGRVRYPSAFGI
jgi:putative acetyltransferase